MKTAHSTIFRTFLASLLAVMPFAVRADDETAAPQNQATREARLTAKWEKATLEELRDAVNKLADQAIQQSHEQDEAGRKLNFAAQDPAYTSPELEELRLKEQQLENQLLETRMAIRKAVEELPEVKAQRQELDKKRAQITELQAERVYVQQLYQKRLRERLKNLDQPQD